VIFLYAHLRITSILARAGRLAEARRHLRVVEKTATTPDREITALIESVRAQVVRGRAISDERLEFRPATAARESGTM
jgi:hypothetical protein